MRHVSRQEFLQPLLVALFLSQVASGVYRATHSDVRPIDRFRFQIASGIFLAAYLLGHMNSAFVFARLYLGIDSDWALATAPSGLVKDAWDTRLMIFVLSHLAAGARALMLSQGVARLYPGIIATGDGRRGRDTKLVVARNRWFESISLQRRVSVSREFAFPMSRSRAFPAGVCGPGRRRDRRRRA